METVLFAFYQRKQTEPAGWGVGCHPSLEERLSMSDVHSPMTVQLIIISLFGQIF